jgi:UDP-2,3-diacylglucosamine hydrolase
MPILFISDLHLHESRPHITRAFFHFLQTHARNTEALYILGDFFDAWVGDDDDSALPQEVAEQLAALTQTGTSVYFMHGNRDFLLGDAYAKKSGMQLLADPTLIDLYGKPTLLLHGDSLCTGDLAYQQFRQMVRGAAWQQQILSQSLAARRALAAQLRQASQNMNSLKAEDIMDVTSAEVIALMEKYNVTQMIHGHTHRPARHSLNINNKLAERIVLGDWHEYGWYLEANEDNLILRKFVIDSHLSLPL